MVTLCLVVGVGSTKLWDQRADDVLSGVRYSVIDNARFRSALEAAAAAMETLQHAADGVNDTVTTNGSGAGAGVSGRPMLPSASEDAIGGAVAAASAVATESGGEHADVHASRLILKTVKVGALSYNPETKEVGDSCDPVMRYCPVRREQLSRLTASTVPASTEGGASSGRETLFLQGTGSAVMRAFLIAM
jgi:hypothetical protein